MDNIENTSPIGVVDVATTPGQLDVNTQPAETTKETPAENVNVGTENVAEAVEASNPWDNDPKFKGKTPDDIYKAYQESEKVIGQNSQKAEVANLIEEKYGLTPEQFKAKIEEQEEQLQQERYDKDPSLAVADKLSALEARIERQDQEKAYREEEAKLDTFLKDNPVYAPNRDKILKLGLTSEQDKSYDEIAVEWFGNSIAQGQQDAYQKIETKKLTQATGSQSSPQRKISVEDMKGMSVAELEAILPKAPVR